MQNKIIIVYGASTELAFIDDIISRAESASSVKFIKFEHHTSWYLRSRFRYILNFMHIATTVLHVLMLAPKSKVIIFGNNPGRILFPFLWMTNLVVVFNELPVMNKSNVLFFYDRLIFRLAHKIYLSSASRVNLVTEMFNLKRKIGYVCNIPAKSISVSEIVASTRKDFIYAGLVNERRFSCLSTMLHDLVGNGQQVIDVYGWKTPGLNLDKRLFNFKGCVAHEDLLKILEGYRYAILNYPTADYNNDYCAPIKIYEYLSCGCIVLSANRNKGLQELAFQYPGIIYFIEDFDQATIGSEISKLIFNDQSAKRCLMDAYQTNLDFVKNALA